MKTITDLVRSFRTNPTLVLLGDNLGSYQWYWKQYSFYSKFVKPEFKLDDETQLGAIVYVVDDMLDEINELLQPYQLHLVVVGGNLYLERI